MENYHEIISVKDLKIGYKEGKKELVLLDGINLSAYKGEFIGLVGKNGIGKTTFLKCLVRLLHPLDGQIELNQTRINKFSLKELARQISYVSTENVNIDNLTVYELVKYGRYAYTNILGINKSRDKAMIMHAIQSVRLEHLKNRKINELSDGEKKKALIARALAQDTPVVILDEPLAFLDLPNKYELVKLLKSTAYNKQKTIVFSIHDINMALQECDKLWLIEDQVVREGAPEDLILNGLVHEMFEDSNIFFDENTGQFKNRSQNIRKIGLIGEGRVACLTEKALSRIFLETGENQEKNVYIQKKNDHYIWIFEDNDDKFVFGSINELVHFLKHKLLT